MSWKTLPLLATALILLEADGLADGMVYRLPADGTWASYTVRMQGAWTPGTGRRQDVDFEGRFTIRSVGRVVHNEQACRWIELERELGPLGKERNRHVLKMLIPEEYLVRGKDPLAHPLLTYFNEKPTDRAGIKPAQGFNRIQYEIDRFRPQFPKPLEDVQRLERETLRTELGTFEECEQFGGRSSYDGPLNADGRWVYEAKYRLALHEKSPFGVVEMEFCSSGREFTGTKEASYATTGKLSLSATGTEAVSALDLPKRDKPKGPVVFIPKGIKTATVSGEVTGPDKRPLAHVTVGFARVLKPRNAIVETETDGTGTFKTECPVGEKVSVRVYRRTARVSGGFKVQLLYRDTIEIPEAGGEFKFTVESR